MSAAESSRNVPATVAVLAGGPSAERAVSLKSGAAVAAALRSLGHRVIEFDPTPANLAQGPWSEVDVAFLALHGEYGEDGQIQAELDRLGVVYTGSPAAASKLAFSKLDAKLAFVSRGVPTPPWSPLDARLSPGQCAARARQLGFPLVVKPDAQGSSLGVSLVREERELGAALDLAFGYGPRLVLEQAIVGQEWTVGLLDSRPLPPLLIAAQSAIFDYQAKYHAPEIQCRLAEADHPDAARVVRAALGAVEAVGACGVSRVDVLVDKLGRPWVLEVNTIPGFTDHSLVPFAAQAVGLDFAGLCQWCLRAALARPERRRAA